MSIHMSLPPISALLTAHSFDTVHTTQPFPALIPRSTGSIPLPAAFAQRALQHPQQPSLPSLSQMLTPPQEFAELQLRQLQQLQHQQQQQQAQQEETQHKEPVHVDLTESKVTRKYKCKVCAKCFTTSGHLARHSRIHTGERKHQCPHEGCEARFARQDNCMQHYRTHKSAKTRRRRAKRE